jgi:hypothetical protein
MFDLISGLKIASIFFLQKIIFKLSQLDLWPFLLPLPPFPPIHPCLIQPLWGLNLHVLGEGRGGNHQTIFISNDFKEIVGSPKS